MKSWKRTIFVAILLLSTLICFGTAIANAEDFSKRHRKPATVSILSISGVITKGSLWLQRFRLTMSSSNITTIIYINSPGGDVSEMHEMLTGMRYTRTTTKCFVDEIAASAAAIIFMSCDERFMNPEAFLMFHMSNTYDKDGKLLKLLVPASDLNSIETTMWYEYSEALRSVEVDKLLTPEEWYRMQKGEDIYITGLQFNERKELLSW